MSDVFVRYKFDKLNKATLLSGHVDQQDGLQRRRSCHLFWSHQSCRVFFATCRDLFRGETKLES